MTLAVYPPIWFLRHGQTEWNAEGRLQGHQDSPLTEQGIKDAHRQAAIIRPVLGANPACFASPLGRAQQTARIALGGIDYRTDDRLKEINAGSWEGRLRGDLLAQHPDWAENPPTALTMFAAAEDAEEIEAFRARIVSFLNDLTGPSVVIAHGLLGQLLRAHVTGVSLDAAGHLSNLQGCVYFLENGHETLLTDT